ncbi:MAG: AAA family ATPase [Blautia sp.]|nr:AAA family ATPase [Blautia sp.]
MTIQQAKDEIKATLQAYMEKDESGMYRYPPERQRPVLLMGPPGVGKTAIMRQIAMESGVGLVSYTMTHHTRQSAIGLPRLVEKEYEGQTYTVTEYTLSEIVASVYEERARTGSREGILFIDEINCVSETLAPLMLQFLQNKQFGNQKLPEGWLLVAAGNPPEYNKSVRDYDIVTLDRVRRIDIEPEADCWLTYASSAGIHGAVLSYLTLHPDRFYHVRQEKKTKSFVTARGWEDLSWILKSYEEAGRSIDEGLIVQFLQDKQEASYFAAFYHVYSKYGQDFGIRQLLAGEKDDRTAELLRAASLEERIMAVIQTVQVLNEETRTFRLSEDVRKKYTDMAAAFRVYIRNQFAECRPAAAVQTPGASEEERSERPGIESGKTGIEAGKPGSGDGTGTTTLELYIRKCEETLEIRQRSGILSRDEERAERSCIRLFKQAEEEARLEHAASTEELQARLSALASELEKQKEERAAHILNMFENAAAFCERSFAHKTDEGEQEMFLLVSTLAQDPDTAVFLAQYPCDALLRWMRDQI